MSALLALMACNSMPASIPNSPGEVNAEIAPDLLAAVSPDIPYLVWATASQVVAEPYRSCPAVTVESNGYLLTANNCYDSVGLLWDGTVSWETAVPNTISFDKFRVDGMRGAWTVNGTMTVEETENAGRVGYIMASRMSVVSLDDPERTFWIDTKGSFSKWPDQYDKALFWFGWDEYDGTIGISDWGTAEIEGDRIWSGHANGCAFADHWVGKMEVNGSNTAVFEFAKDDPADDPDAEPTSDAVPQGPGGDTGDTADTGDTSDSGDTADTSDTSDTADTADTANGPDGAFPTWPDEDDLRACGQCNALSVDGTRVEGCIDLGRSLEYPFFTEFPY